MIKRSNIYLGQKLAKTCSSVGSRAKLDDPVECTSGGDPFLLYKILHLLRLESRKKLTKCS